jgi:hypothetical protein
LMSVLWKKNYILMILIIIFFHLIYAFNW